MVQKCLLHAQASGDLVRMDETDKGGSTLIDRLHGAHGAKRRNKGQCSVYVDDALLADCDRLGIEIESKLFRDLLRKHVSGVERQLMLQLGDCSNCRLKLLSERMLDLAKSLKLT